jgi:GDP-L-fucose synthase
MKLTDKIYVAGHNGLVGSAILRLLIKKGYSNIITRSSAELDLRDQKQVNDFFEQIQPAYVFLAAAKVGGF